MLLADLDALPDAAFSQKFSTEARTVADIMYEITLVNDHICMVLRGEEPFPWPEGGWINAPENLRTKEAVIDSFRACSERTITTAEGLTSEQMEQTVDTERGPVTRFERCQFMALHMWYHSGQLNFIQTLRGDSEWHW